jgi:hypothetical protein
MLFPVAVGVILSLFWTRRTTGDDFRVAGVWLLLVALPIAVACDHARPRVADPSTVNRTEAVALCAVAAAFVYLNRHNGRVSSTAAWLVGLGVGLNSLGVLVYGYMPVLQSAAAVADNSFTSSHPSPGYVRSEDLGWFGVAIGDFIPIPHLLKVLSVGDLLLFAGCVLLLSIFLAGLWRDGRHQVGSPEPVPGEEVTHGQEVDSAHACVPGAGGVCRRGVHGVLVRGPVRHSALIAGWRGVARNPAQSPIGQTHRNSDDACIRRSRGCS